MDFLVFLRPSPPESRAEAATDYVIDEGTVQDQWFTGSLEAPSPALTKAGIFAIGPLRHLARVNTGAYGNSGWAHYSVPQNNLNQLQYGDATQNTASPTG